jgi:hypothetical protein
MNMKAVPENTQQNVSGAANRLSALISDDPIKKDGTPDTDGADDQDDPANAKDDSDPDTGDDDQDPPSGDTGDDPDADQDTDDQDGDDTGDDDEPLYSVKVGDSTVEVTMEDLQKGYMRQSDYSSKAAALAKDREAIEAKQEKIDQQLADAKLLIDADEDRLNSDEMKALKQDDPEAYLEELDKAQARLDKFKKLKEKRDTEQAERKQGLVKKERESLLIAFPEWSDPSVQQKESTELFDVLLKIGYTEKELSDLTDHRLFVLANAQRHLSALQSKSLKDKEKKPKAKAMKAGTVTDKAKTDSEARKQRRATLKKTGKVRDAAALLSTN